jgi:hypothetical protein
MIQSRRGISGDDLFFTTGALVGGTASAAYGVGKVVFEIGKGLGEFIGEMVEDERRYARVKKLAGKVKASDAPLVAPWIGPNDAYGKFKHLGILDAVYDGSANPSQVPSSTAT